MISEVIRDAPPERRGEQSVLESNLEMLRQNPYPGRGIVMGLSENSRKAYQVYWITGRSENSQNRILVEEDEVIQTQACDESKISDPSNIFYNALRRAANRHIVSNGNHTDIIYEAIRSGKSLIETTYSLNPEEDIPNTPRITGVFAHHAGTPFVFSIARKDSDGIKNLHKTFMPLPKAGIGHCIHTYKTDGNPPPPFDRDPYPVPLKGNIEEIADTYWGALSIDNRVSLAVKEIERDSGKSKVLIKNRHIL